MDASDVGFGAVLLQERKDDIDLPNRYFSYTFDNHQKKYPQFQKKYLPYCYLSSILIYILPIRGVH